MEKPEDELLNIKIFDKYKTQELIGQGAFGVVYQGKNILTRESVAIKIVIICVK